MKWKIETSSSVIFSMSLIIRTLCKTAVVPIPTTAHRPFIELSWGDC